MASTKTSASRIPPAVDEHPAVRQQHKRRLELTASLATIQADLDHVRAERVRLGQDIVNRRAAQLLTDSSSTPIEDDSDRRLADLDTQIAALKGRIDPLQLALHQQAVIARGVREDVQRDVNQNLVNAGRRVAEDMIPLVNTLQMLNAELVALYERGGGRVTLPMPLHPGILQTWLEHALPLTEPHR